MMFKKLKGLLSFVICISMLCTVMPITSYAENNAASVTFNGNTEYYTTIDAAWAAAVALDTTAENKATIQMLVNCKTENTLTNTADYLVLDTNGKTLTTPNAIHGKNEILCGIGAEGGSLEITGNGTITGITLYDYGRAIVLITGGEVYVNGVTIRNTGGSAGNAVRVEGGTFHFLEGYLISASEYALYAAKGKVYLYSGKIESNGRLAMAADEISLDIQICYSDKPLYFVDNDTDNWGLISSMRKVHLADNLIMDLEYSDNSDGSDFAKLKNVTEISGTANDNRNYLKIQTYKTSYLFDTKYASTLLSKIKNDGVTDLSENGFTAVHFVDLADYDLTNVTYSDYSASSDGSVKAWVNGTELYIGGDGKIIAGSSLRRAFNQGLNINAITGIDMLDTSNVTDMESMFDKCGQNSTSFTLDLGDNFDTSNVTKMSSMFMCCGQNSPVFTLNLGNLFDTSKVTNTDYMFMCCGEKSKVLTLDLGDKFDTSNVVNMGNMFTRCGSSSKVFTLDLGDKFDTSNVTVSMSLMFNQCGQFSDVFKELDLSGFTISPAYKGAFIGFAANIPVTKFIFGKGWRNAKLPAVGTSSFGFAASSTKNMPTEIVGAPKNLRSFDWTSDNRIVTFTDNVTYTITAKADGGGTVSGGGTVLDGESITLNAAANDGYIFDGWYDGDTKVCDTAEFVIEDAADDKTYTAKFTTYYKVSAEVGTDGGGTVSGGGKVAKGGSITLTAAANDGYTFDGWYDGETKVCETAEFTVSNVTADKTYTAKFTKNTVYYTISAEVGTDGGGMVSGGGKAAEGDSITLTATANDGYTFEGWYDGDTKVCDTAKFTVSNVTADKTYTAKFTKNQVVDPEPENPEIPYLKWDGSTLTLVKKQDASCKVGIVYVGGATFDANNINWDKLVAVGKEYANLNTSAGYVVYNNFTKRTPGTRGNYVAFVKYTKEDGTTKADYITYNVKDAVSFEIPALSYNTKTKTLKMTGNVSSTIGIAYVGDSKVKTSNITWNDFIKAGKKYPDINGSGGYVKVLNTLDYKEALGTNGNYVAFIKYFDENLNKSIAKYYTFTVDDYNSQPTDAPFAVAEENKIILTASGFDVTKVTIVYIGTDDMYISNWSDFSAAAAKFPDINGKSLNQQYTNPQDGSAWTQNTDGWYAVYIRYINDGKTCNSYYTVEVK